MIRFSIPKEAQASWGNCMSSTSPLQRGILSILCQRLDDPPLHSLQGHQRICFGKSVLRMELHKNCLHPLIAHLPVAGHLSHGPQDLSGVLLLVAGPHGLALAGPQDGDLLTGRVGGCVVPFWPTSGNLRHELDAKAAFDALA